MDTMTLPMGATFWGSLGFLEWKRWEKVRAQREVVLGSSVGTIDAL